MVDSSERGSWYAAKGRDDDVVLSTRARLSRNLCDFLFPHKMSADDRERVRSLVYDAASFNPEYVMVSCDDLSTAQKRLLQDKLILSGRECSAILLPGSHEDSFCLINETDHLKIVEFSAGFDSERVTRLCYEKDSLFQEHLQFAGSFELGYLTSRLRDLGSGLKLTLRFFIPSVVLSGNLHEVSSTLEEKGCFLNPVYPATDSRADFSNFIFDLTSTNAFSAPELEQLAQCDSAARLLLKTERKISREFADNNPTVVLNFFKQSYAKAMNSLLLSYDEAVDIISCVKWALSLHIITGITHEDLNSLYYNVKDGCLDYMCASYEYNFEPDVKSDANLQLKRLRAAVIQQTFEGIKNEKSVS